jgi:hypothetical protein
MTATTDYKCNFLLVLSCEQIAFQDDFNFHVTVLWLRSFLCMLMTLFHFPWYIQPIVAVPAFLCADAFQKVLPFCTGFAAGCMIWIVIAEVLPDAFKVTTVWLSRNCK